MPWSRKPQHLEEALKPLNRPPEPNNLIRINTQVLRADKRVVNLPRINLLPELELQPELHQS